MENGNQIGIVVFGALLACIIAGPNHSIAATIIVDHLGTGDYVTIQPALDFASEGDTVLVLPGVYVGVENRGLRFWGKDLVLRSELGPLETTIDCEYMAEGMSFESGESNAAKVQGFTITHGSLNGYIGGIHCGNNSSPTISDVILIENSAFQFYSGGGGLDCIDSSPLLSNVQFIGNLAEAGGGGGMRCTGMSSPSLTNVVFKGNITIGSGGGMAAFDGCSPILIGVSFLENVSGIKGGGLCLVAISGLSLQGVLFDGNRSGKGGGLYCSSSSIDLSDVVFVDNKADIMPGIGGALYTHICDTRISMCTFFRNSSIASGASIFIGSPTAMLVEQSIISYSHGSVAISWDEGGAQPLFECCDVYGNYEGGYDDAIGDQTGMNGNISEDPLFCGGNSPDEFILEVHANSPVLPENNECGVQIGAFGEGCTVTSVPEFEKILGTTISNIKSLY